MITDLRPGGAQDNTILNANGQAAAGLKVAVAAGPFRSRHSLLSSVTYFPLESLQRSIAPLKDFRAALEIRAVIDSWRPSLIHTHLSKAGFIARVIAPRTTPVIHTIHTFPFHLGQSPLAYRTHVLLERFLATRTDLYLAVATRNVEKSLAHGIGRTEKYRVVHSGLDIGPLEMAAIQSRSDLRRKRGIPEGAIVVGTVARLVEQKNPTCFVRAAARVSRIRDGFFFCVVGDGPLRGAMESLAREFGMTNIIFAGEQPDGYNWLRCFDMFVHTSFYEGMGRVIGEAMIVGTPVIATAVDGVLDAIGDNGARGLGVPPNDPEAIAHAVIQLTSDPSRTLAMTDRAKEWAESQLTAGRMVAETIAAYRDLLAGLTSSRTSSTAA